MLRLLLILSICLSVCAQAQTASIAVAANMKDAFSEISSAFKSTGKPNPKVIYGSSGNFTAQIMNGAPFNLLISADERFPLELYRNRKQSTRGRCMPLENWLSLLNILPALS